MPQVKLRPSMSTDNFQSAYSAVEPTRNEIDALRGVAVLEFGAPWCPICQAAQRNIESVIREQPHIKHIKVEDGSGRPLGRSFGIKLWPTLVVLKNGIEVGCVVRPANAAALWEVVSKSN